MHNIPTIQAFFATLFQSEKAQNIPKIWLKLVVLKKFIFLRKNGQCRAGGGGEADFRGGGSRGVEGQQGVHPVSYRTRNPR